MLRASGPAAGNRPGKGEIRGRPSFASAALLTYFTTVGSAVLGLANVLIVARTLGTAGRGDVAFLMTVAGLTSAVSLFGVEQANVNIAGREPDRRPALATNSVVLALYFGGLAALIVAALMAVFPAVSGHQPVKLLALALASVPLLVLGQYLQLLVQADRRFMFSNAVVLLGAVSNVGVNGTLAAIGSITVTTAFATWVAGQLAGTLLLSWYVWRRLAGFGRADVLLAQRSVTFGVKAHMNRVMSLGNYRLDQWIVQGVWGSNELGLYSIAVAWAEALYFLPTALSTVQRPDLVRATAEDAAQRAARVCRSAFVLTIPIAAAMVVLAPFLCVTIFGEAFRGSIDDLRLLVPGAFGIIAIKLLGGALTAQNQPLRQTLAVLIGFVTTIALDVALIPPYGGAGAALASTIAYTVSGAASMAIFLRVLGGRSRDLVPRPGDVRDLWRHARSMARL